MVITPSGAVAQVVGVDMNLSEAIVQWANGDRAIFKFSHLRPRKPKK